jgi:hypothetical protein
MEHQQIKYRTVMDLGFTEEIHPDTQYFNQYGYPWAIINLQLTKRIYLEWEKESRLCWIVRTNKEEFIQARRPIFNEAHLRDVVSFFLEKDEKAMVTEQPFDYTQFA